MTMHVFPVCMNRKYSFIIIPKYIFRKMFQYIHCLFCRNFLLWRKRNNHMISLSFTYLVKYILCFFHLLKCSIRQAVDTAHQNTFFCLVWILDILQSIFQMRCRISAFWLFNVDTQMAQNSEKGRDFRGCFLRISTQTAQIGKIGRDSKFRRPLCCF